MSCRIGDGGDTSLNRDHLKTLPEGTKNISQQCRMRELKLVKLCLSMPLQISPDVPK
jgi:hypothetical protein